jgi:hypothetical protein
LEPAVVVFVGGQCGLGHRRRPKGQECQPIYSRHLFPVPDGKPLGPGHFKWPSTTPTPSRFQEPACGPGKDGFQKKKKKKKKWSEKRQQTIKENNWETALITDGFPFALLFVFSFPFSSLPFLTPS